MQKYFFDIQGKKLTFAVGTFYEDICHFAWKADCQEE
jgi:hypothetical protein